MENQFKILIINLLLLFVCLENINGYDNIFSHFLHFNYLSLYLCE